MAGSASAVKDLLHSDTFDTRGIVRSVVASNDICESRLVGRVETFSPLISLFGMSIYTAVVNDLRGKKKWPLTARDASHPVSRDRFETLFIRLRTELESVTARISSSIRCLWIF